MTGRGRKRHRLRPRWPVRPEEDEESAEEVESNGEGGGRGGEGAANKGNRGNMWLLFGWICRFHVVLGEKVFFLNSQKQLSFGG